MSASTKSVAGSSQSKSYGIDVADVEYLRHGDVPLLARLYKPRGAGPFPMLVDAHGGAWCNSDRLNNAATNEALARSGVVVAALDFRMPPQAGYPASLADINYGVRWMKSKAAEFKGRADRIGLIGNSSGAHQIMLVAMRPNDRRYNAVPLAGAASRDARVGCVVLCWPVIDPLGRYRYAKRMKAEGGALADVGRVIPAHDRYWGSEAAMEEGNPVGALERGAPAELPPALYLQGTADVMHPRVDLDRFVAQYRNRGAELELEFYEGEGEAFISRKPDSPASRRAIERIIAFVHQRLG